MSKTKKLKLEIGQRVWLEIRFYRMWRGGGYDRRISEVEVVRANKTSAYVVDIEDLDAEKVYERKIAQKTLSGDGGTFGTTYHVWFSKEDFEASVQRKIDTANARNEAHELIDKMSLERLQKFIQEVTA
ncbi:beta barrel domain-containing protein [Lysinibacillus sp. TE18511]